MLELNIIKAIKIVYRGEVIKHGTVNEDSLRAKPLLIRLWFCIAYIRKLANQILVQSVDTWQYIKAIVV